MGRQQTRHVHAAIEVAARVAAEVDDDPSDSLGLDGLEGLVRVRARGRVRVRARVRVSSLPSHLRRRCR